MDRRSTEGCAAARVRVESVRFISVLNLSAFALLAAAPTHAADLSTTLQTDWHAPRSAAFAQAAAALPPAVERLCRATPEHAEAALAGARLAWTDGLSSWERLAGVAIGPVLERRAQRALDFTPTRPRLIEKAIKSAPRAAADMELVGTPAKGLPALEWLLWTRPVRPGTPDCAYAVQVARELDREAAALAAARPAARDEPGRLAELVNQWVGGIERLRWPGMEMPLRVAMTAGPATPPDWPRTASGAYALAWAAQWDALRGLAVSGEASLAGQLRARGKTGLADALAAEVAALDTRMAGLDGRDRAAVLAAAQALAGLKHRVETEVAPALGVVIGFSDADGD